MNFIVLYVIAALNSFSVLSDSVPVYPQNYFINPLDLPMTLAGNFGEPRKLHFHTGLDFRTNAEEGHAVFAAADGYVSRINVSGAGYGNALYITHPNGYTTVYGHLKKFAPKIMERLRKEQYTKQSFSVDFSLQPNEIAVKQGDTVALSGNTGGSGGPHLHFEVRDALERTINPLLFGYSLKDEVKPTINYLKFYPMDDLKYKCDGYRSKPLLKDGVYQITGGIIKLNAAQVGISVNTWDGLSGSENHVGIYAMKMYRDDNLIYEYKIDRIAFPDKRYVLSHVDYPVFINEGSKSFHKCFVESGNHLPAYSNLIQQGVVDISDSKTHKIRIEVSDYTGNLSRVEFKIQQDNTASLFKEKPFTYTTRFDYDHENSFETKDIMVKLPQGCLFENAYLNYNSTTATDTTVFSKIHTLGKNSTQVFDWFDLALKAENLNPKFQNKALIVYRDEGGATSPRGGTFKDGFIFSRTRDFGTYFVKIDTTPPRILPLNVAAGKNMRVYKKLLFKISDNLSGISDFDTYIDGSWVVTEYDQKTATLTHTLDQSLTVGEHIFKVVVEDERKNKRELSIKFKM